MGFQMNLSEGTIAKWNVTMRYSRIIDGVRLRSLNNSGAIGDLLEGGVGYDYVIFKLVGHTNYFHFIIDAYENYTSSLLPITTRAVPDGTFKEWGTVDYASKMIEYVLKFLYNLNSNLIQFQWKTRFYSYQ
jgi:hypothetical protein